MRRLFPILLLLLASCGSGDAPEANRADVPQPSGPPLAQQADSVPSSAPKTEAPRWESAVTGAGTALRLVDSGGKEIFSIACLRSPRRLIAMVPGFTRIGSEDRFSLGLGDEPVTLVADSTQQAPGGIAAEGAVPEGFDDLFGKAEQVSAVYGQQQVGPVPAPPEALKEMLVKSCSGSK